MGGANDLTAAYPQPSVVTIEGREYRVDPLRVADLSALGERIRDRRVDALLRNRAKVPNQEVLSQ